MVEAHTIPVGLARRRRSSQEEITTIGLACTVDVLRTLPPPQSVGFDEAVVRRS